LLAHPTEGGGSVADVQLVNSATSTAEIERPVAIAWVAIDPNLAGDSASEEEVFIEFLVMWSSAKFGDSQLVNAKEEYFWKMGKAFPEDPFFHRRMAYFLDYFLFERLVDIIGSPYSGKTPFEIYRSEAPSCRPGWEMTSFRHSVFQVGRFLPLGFIAEDLMSGVKVTISRKQGERHDGLRSKKLFQGFLYGMGERYVLSRGLIFHPERAARLVGKEVKAAKKSGGLDRPRLLSRLARQEIRCLRHPHVDARLIYSEDPR
jgi:hypothetical protein